MKTLKLLGTLMVALALLIIPGVTHADDTEGETRELSGSLWSANTGWTLFGSYAGNQAFEATPSGDVTGWGWSENIGWLKFDPDFTGISGQGDNYGTVFNLDTNDMTGWARFCAGTLNGDCESGSRRDGWDGWLKFTDVAITEVSNDDTTEYTASGYAWGGPVVGWVAVKLSTTEECEEDCGPGGGGNLGCYISTGNTQVNPEATYGFSWASTGGADECESEDFSISEGETSGSHLEDWPGAGVQASKQYSITCYDGSNSGSCSVTFTEDIEEDTGELTADLYFNTMTAPNTSGQRQIAATQGQRQGNVNPIGPFSVRLGSVLNFVWESNGASSCTITSDAFSVSDESPEGVQEYVINEDVDINVQLQCSDDTDTVRDELIIQVTDPVFREF